MAKTKFANVDEYISGQPETTKVALRLVRSTIRKALPEAEEVISYNIPAYKLHSDVVLYFAGGSTTRCTRRANASWRP